MRALAIGTVLFLCACSDEPTQSEQALRAEADVAAVRAANHTPPPLEEVTPEPILHPDIEQHDLYGMACSYAPGTSLGARVIAREVDAFMKIDGEMIRFAADPGSRELPMLTRSHYNSRSSSLQLRLDGKGAEVNPGVMQYDGTITLRDPYGRVIYQGSGVARCSS